MQRVEFVKSQLNQDNYALLPKSETNGPVYKIPVSGCLSTDGFEIYYMFIPVGSSIKEHKCEDFAERYTVVSGDIIDDNNLAHIGDSHGIKSLDEDTIVEVIKVARNCVPGFSDLPYSELEDMIEHLAREAQETIVDKAIKRYNPFEIIILPDKDDIYRLAYKKPVLNNDAKSSRKSCCYDLFDDSFIGSYDDDLLMHHITFGRLLKDTGFSKIEGNLTKRYIFELWRDLAPEMANYRLIPTKNPQFVYEPKQVKFPCHDGQIRVRINNLYIVKDVNRQNRLCTYGPDHTFRNYFTLYNNENDKDYTLGWRENEEKILRLSEAAKAIGLNPPAMCTLDEVCILWANVTYYLKDFKFNDDTANLWAPYFNDFTYEKGTR